ncbi:TIGR02221 family CRISPR-associated protein [bacterium]|nr:TIGR02221 family CRISPR-associated protein [bacterium]
MRTLISFIGTGSLDKEKSDRKYRTATYTINGMEVGTDSFVSSVLFHHFKIDRLILIGTTRSMWEEVYEQFAKKRGVSFDEEYYYKLGGWAEANNHSTPLDSFDMSTLETTLGNNSKVRLIPYGLNVEEQWNTFNILTEVFQDLGEGEEIFLDVTHAFRSLPIFSMTSLFYLQDVLQKSVKLKGIYYGMLETSKEFNNKAPIVDLSLILKIQEWVKGAHSFLNYGKGYLLADLLENKSQAVVLNQFSDALSLNYLTEIETQLKNFKKLADQIESPIAKMILPPVLGDFTNKLLRSKTQSRFQLELSIWHRKNKNYFSAFLVFTESLITYVCEQEFGKWAKLSYRGQAKLRMDKFGLNEIYQEAKTIRNNLAHNQKKKTNTVNNNIVFLTKSQNQFLQKILSN